MLVSRCYSVLDTLVVEISCVHLSAPEESHLVLREERRHYAGTVREALGGLLDVCELAVFHLEAEQRRTGQQSLAACVP